MPLPLLFAIAVAQGQSTLGPVIPPTSGPPLAAQQQQTPPLQAPTPPPANGAAQQPFSSPFVVASPDRIALTPKIDGKIDEEEWDPLASSPDMKSYFEWEPGKLYIAAVVPTGHDLVASFDLHANGWLIGKDNLEVRISSGQGTPTVTCRVMDATGIAGPKWIDVPGLSLSSVAASSTDGTNTTYEACIGDNGLDIIPTEPGRKLLMRMDDPLSTDPPAPAYLPRSMAPVDLVLFRSVALPAGLRFNPQSIGRSSVAGESTHVRLGFDGSNSMKIARLEMHSEGFAKNDTDSRAAVFPKFDTKGRAFVDYNTDIAEGSPQGYRVLKGTLTTADGLSAITECSYRVGPIVDFEIPKQEIPVADMDRSIKLPFWVNSNSAHRINGEVTVLVPDPLRVLNGADRKIILVTNRGRDRNTIELFIPKNTSGTIPIKFSAVINKKKIEQTQFINIGSL